MKWVIALFLLVLLLLTIVLLNPLRRSEDTIKEYLEKTIPIGSSIDNAEQELRKRYSSQISKSSLGFYKTERRKPAETIGVSSIRVRLGEYWSFPFFRTAVIAFLGFDENDRLIEIWIRKDTDGI